MFHNFELRGFSGEERAAARKQCQKALDALEFLERKIDAALLDARLSEGSKRFIEKLWWGHRAAAEMSLGNKAVWEAHAKASILSHLEFAREKSDFTGGGKRARLITLSPSLGIEGVGKISLRLPQLRGFADRAARKLDANAFFTLDVALFAPSRGVVADIFAQHVQGTLWAQKAEFAPRKEARRVCDANGNVNSLGAKVAVITARGACRGKQLTAEDVAGLGWYTSKASCGVNTCYQSKKGLRSECSHTGWTMELALRQLELWSHTCVLDACWAVGEGTMLRTLWRNKLMRGLDCTLDSRIGIPHDERAAAWAKIWRELGTGFQPI